MSRRDDFLSRWSRKKRGEAPGEPETEPAGEPVPEAAEKTDAEILEELGLPDPDTLGPGDDIKGFMAKAVPERLRTRALRKLWLSNPVLANLDELLEYGEDYTDAATVVANLVSAWNVGKGYARPEPDPAPPEAAESAVPPPEEAEAPPPDAAGVQLEPPAAEETGGAAAEPTTEEAGPDEAPAEPAPRAPRRMRFSFEA